MHKSITSGNAMKGGNVVFDSETWPGVIEVLVITGGCIFLIVSLYLYTEWRFHRTIKKAQEEARELRQKIEWQKRLEARKRQPK
jgi:preprotein translocase subunit SecG